MNSNRETNAEKGKTTHFDSTVDNFSLIGSEDLHFAGYFESESDDIVTSIQNLNKFVAHKLNLSASKHLLDVGCGTGGTSCYLAETCGCRVTGIDVGETQLAAANRLAERKGITDRTAFLRQDATNLSFPSETFDAVLLLGTAFHIQDKAKLFAECARVAKPVSDIVILDFFVNDRTRFNDRKTLRKRQVLNAFFGDPAFTDSDVYVNALQSVGYEVQEREDMSSHVVLSCDAWERSLKEREDHAIEILGKPAYLSILIAARTLKQAMEQGLLAGLMMSTTRR